MKWYHILIAFILGLLLGAFSYSYWPSPNIDIENPLIHHYKEEMEWRDVNETKLKDTIKSLRAEKKVIHQNNTQHQAESNKTAQRFAQMRKAIPLTRVDTIRFLVQDTISCDSALTRARELAAGLTIEIITDNAIIKNLDSLNSNLNADKKDLVKVDSLNQIEKKQLRKEARRKARRAFFTGAGIGGAIVAILVAII